MTSGVIVGGIFLSGHQLLRVKKLTVSSGPDLVDDGRLEVDEDSAGDVLSGAGFCRQDQVVGWVVLLMTILPLCFHHLCYFVNSGNTTNQKTSKD